LINPAIALNSILVFSGIISVFFLRSMQKSQVLSIGEKMYTIIFSLSFVELGLVILAFIYGSFPQSGLSWDSVYANLYNAKWYVELNSFLPLEESISSLFPQHAVMYYSLFYAIGKFRLLQVAYLLPFFLLMFSVRAILEKIHAKHWYKILVRLLLFVPIVLAQSSSGYYDLFITSLIVLSLYAVYYAQTIKPAIRAVSFSLFLGIAIASKYFAAILIPMIGELLFHTVNRKSLLQLSLFQRMFVAGTCLVLLFIPISYWMMRSHAHTGSPVFPFFQNIFRTDKYWTFGSSVDQNPMTQTKMSGISWMKGGIFLYPIVTYFQTEYYVEATRGYTGFVYVIVVPLQFFLLGIFIWKIWKRKADSQELLYLFLFFSLFIVGTVVRYYRYLWPFQFSFGLFTFILAWKYIQKIHISQTILLTGVVFLYMIHAVDIAESFRYVPEPKKHQLLYPEALQVDGSDSIFAVINTSKDKRPVLDASQYFLLRLYFSKRTYLCNWYWIAGDQKTHSILEEGKDATNKFIQKFSYIITSADPSSPVNYCSSLIDLYKNLTPVAHDAYHIVYKVD